jgi:UDP-galactopyranose mutase
MALAYVIGAGTAGSTAARILKDNGWDVEIFETRSYISGNCYDYIDEKTRCIVHAHGPHAIHTNSEKVWNWLHQFSDFNDFSVRVWANTKLGKIPIPYNDTSDKIIGRKLSDNEIIDLVFRDYSEKMWGTPFEDLPQSKVFLPEFLLEILEKHHTSAIISIKVFLKVDLLKCLKTFWMAFQFI